MKLIKINTNHYIIVDDSEIQEGEFVYDLARCVIGKHGIDDYLSDHCKKITHSTEPLESSSKIGKYWGKVQPIDLSEVKELIGEVDVLQESKNYVLSKFKSDTDLEQLNCYKHIETYILGYNQAIEDNKERKYTEAQLIWAIQEAYGHGQNDEFDGVNKVEKSIIFITNYLQPKTEWEVEFIDNKLTLKQ